MRQRLPGGGRLNEACRRTPPLRVTSKVSARGFGGVHAAAARARADEKQGPGNTGESAAVWHVPAVDVNMRATPPACCLCESGESGARADSAPDARPLSRLSLMAVRALVSDDANRSVRSLPDIRPAGGVMASALLCVVLRMRAAKIAGLPTRSASESSSRSRLMVKKKKMHTSRTVSIRASSVPASAPSTWKQSWRASERASLTSIPIEHRPSQKRSYERFDRKTSRNPSASPSSVTKTWCT
mmetsp:Transcript_19584/g.50587  ORF Transcript_19584/g.50587 Transcript_19584/m.50587 type:complete len:243 (+) Transcript_19584:1193-1921(+)